MRTPYHVVLGLPEARALSKFLRLAYIPYSEDLLPLRRLVDAADRMVQDAEHRGDA